MGKRTNFPKKNRDFYATPFSAVLPLLGHLRPSTAFHEPCVGSFDLVAHLENYNHKCVESGDIATGQNALNIKKTKGDLFITNPPWTWATLNSLISHLSNIQKTWLLLNADVMHNKRMSLHLKRCIKIVSVGRVSWMQNGINGYENCAWFLFDQNHFGATIFVGRPNE